VRYRAILEYDGTDFWGFQRQVNGRTVQEVVETALYKLNDNSPVTLYAAGRTDSGVHASGQIVAFDLPSWRHDLAVLHRAINAHLPRDVAMREIEPVADNFSPRFDAKSRRYEYLIFNAPVRSARWSRFSWHVMKPLDVQAMQTASKVLLGTHDFATFGTAPIVGGHTIRELFCVDWQVETVSTGLLLKFEIEGNAFLFRMVRNIVGAMSRVGLHEWTVADIERILAAKDRKLSPVPAPPQGLTLVKVTF